MGTMVAALYVQKGGCYYGLPDVDPWDEERDARQYAGPWPVVAHPPCERWCRLAGLVEARWGHKQGEDGGCFDAALKAVRKWGGVLEHPAYSDAWAAFGLNRPPSSGGWVTADFEGGWTCHVEQGRYGHVAKKATWLYAFGVDVASLQWGSVPDQRSEALVSWCGNRTFARSVAPLRRDGDRLRGGFTVSGDRTQAHMSQAARSRTPPEFRDLLLSMARGAAERRKGHACPLTGFYGCPREPGNCCDPLPEDRAQMHEYETNIQEGGWCTHCGRAATDWRHARRRDGT